MQLQILMNYRSNHPEVFLRKGVIKICSNFTGEHPCRGVILIELLCNFIEIGLRHICSPVNLLHIFRTPLPRNTSVWLLLHLVVTYPCHSFSFLFQEAFSSRTSKTLKLVFSLLKKVENNKSFFINLYFFVCFEKCSCGITYNPLRVSLR